MESSLISFFNGVFNSGVLYGPWTPIYGIGAIVIILIYNFLDKRLKNNLLKFILLFLLSSIILTILEWCAGMAIEIIFNKIYWNYENMKYNIGHYISLEVSLIWGCTSIVVTYILRPLIDKIINYFPNWLTYLLVFLFVLDSILTAIIK